MDLPEFACFSPFIPAEWGAAHGVRLTRLARPPAAAQRAPREGRCTYAVSALELAQGFLAAGGAGAVFTTSCDQMRRSAELLAPAERVFLFNLPHTWETPLPHRLFRQELLRLSGFLCRAGGRAFAEEDLAAAMRRFDGARRELLARRETSRAATFARLLLAFHERADGSLPETAAQEARPARGPGVAVLGGPLLERDLWLLDLIEESGGRVVLNATDTGERTLPRFFERSRLVADPLGELADAYFGHIPDVFRRPNSELFRYLERELSARAAQGAVLVMPVWCDFWRAEAERLRGWLPCPLAAIDLADDANGRQRARTRIQALLETIS
ncbi:MAG: 2-hydroxyacyl-CoA dehydratase [Planctomycetes bacterium]|nr:2-hydroxyacyl-CoA dehydratase [Planctomycetota bacterium]